MILDILIAFIIVFFAYVGYKRGFVKTISRLLCFVISVVVAKIMYPYIAKFVSDSFIGDAIYKRVSEYTSSYIPQSSPDFIKQAGDFATGGIYGTMIDIVSVLLIIAVTYFVTKLLGISLNIVSKLPVISFFNHGAGFITGLVFGLLISYAAVSLVIFYNPQSASKMLENSVIAYKMYSENILINLIF